MKPNYFSLCLLLAALLASCELMAEKPAAVAAFNGEYVIVDSASKAVLTTIKTDDQGRVSRAVQRDPAGGVGATRSYYYDSTDRLSRMDEHIATRSPRSVIFTSRESADESGRLQELVIESSEGDTYENRFDYDEAGALRSESLMVNRSATLSKEYADDNE
jgi:hypothetical protein